MEVEIQAAQDRLLEKRRALLSQTNPELIGQVTVNLQPVEEVVAVYPALSPEVEEMLRQEDRDRRERLKQERISRYLADSCIGDRFRGKTFDDYVPANEKAAKVLAACRLYAGQFRSGSGQSLIFVGSLGTGKNMLSAVIGQEIIQRGHSFLHTTAVKLVRKFKDSWKQDRLTEEAVLRYFVGPDLLVLDEIGVQFDTATERLYITEVINDRYEAMKSTILLSNLTVPQIEETIGGRACDRLRENGGRVLVFDWPSYRRNCL